MRADLPYTSDVEAMSVGVPEAAAKRSTDTVSVIRVIEEAYGRAFPDWLVYRGWALFESRDFRGAERVWTRYLEIAPADGDRESVRQLHALELFRDVDIALAVGAMDDVKHAAVGK